MQDLVQVLSEIRSCCQQHGAALRNNEMLTRYSLIDPLLRALGWNTEDPAVVIPEYTTPTGRLDYVLFWNDDPYIGIEAKALGTNLQQARQMGFQYCWQNKIPFFVATDGDIWELYDISSLGGNQIFTVQICSSQLLGHIAQKLLRLHLLAMPILAAPGSPARVAAPVATPTVPVPSPVSVPSSSHGATPPVSPSPSGTCHSFDQLKQNGFPVTGEKPKQVVFPNSVSIPVTTWKDVLITVVKELDGRGCLPAPPFKMGVRQAATLCDTTPASVRQPKDVQTQHYGTLYVETNLSAVSIADAIYKLLQAANQQCPDISAQTVCVVI